MVGCVNVFSRNLFGRRSYTRTVSVAGKKRKIFGSGCVLCEDVLQLHSKIESNSERKSVSAGENNLDDIFYGDAAGGGVARGYSLRSGCRIASSHGHGGGDLGEFISGAVDPPAAPARIPLAAAFSQIGCADRPFGVSGTPEGPHGEEIPDIRLGTVGSGSLAGYRGLDWGTGGRCAGYPDADGPAGHCRWGGHCRFGSDGYDLRCGGHIKIRIYKTAAAWVQFLPASLLFF